MHSKAVIPCCAARSVITELCSAARFCASLPAPRICRISRPMRRCPKLLLRAKNRCSSLEPSRADNRPQSFFRETSAYRNFGGDMETITVTHSTAAILEVLRGQMNMVNSVVRRNLGGITHDESLTAPGTGGNCCNWVLGHLVNSNEQMLEMLGQPAVLEEETLRRYRRGSPELHDRAEALPLEKLLAAWEESCVRIDAGLGSMSQERFDAPA